MSKKKEYEWERLNGREFTVLDLETTGLHPDKGARIIEIGAVKIRDGKIVDEFSTFIYPEQKIPKKIIEHTGITDDMVTEAPVIGNILYDFYEFLGDSIIVAHNAKFDWDRFLLYYFKTVGIVPKNNLIDTIELSKTTFPKEKKHSLDKMCEYLNIEMLNHHRAIDDAKMTATAFLKMLDIHKDCIPECTDLKKADIKLTEPKVNIRKVSYWERMMPKKKVITHQRQYVNLYFNGTFVSAYFDIPYKCWYVKDCDIPVDLKLVEKKVLEFLKLETIDDLCNFRN